MNIARPKSADAILDPFAGFGGLVSEAKRRDSGSLSPTSTKVCPRGFHRLARNPFVLPTPVLCRFPPVISI
jgi:hypothetical protein